MKRLSKIMVLSAMSILLAGCGHTPKDSEMPVTPQPVGGQMGDESAIREEGDAMVTTPIALAASEFEYDQKVINGTVGQRISITLTNTGEMPHDIKLDEFGIGTKVLEPGQSETIYLILDKAGEFEYYCSVGNHRAQGMVGKLIVQ